MADSSVPVRKGRGFTDGATVRPAATASQKTDMANDPNANAHRRPSGGARQRSSSRSRSRDRRDRGGGGGDRRYDSRGGGDRERYRSRSRDRRRSRSRSYERDRGRPAPPPAPAPMGSGNPPPGSVIIMSNSRRTAEAVAKAQSGGGIVGEDAIAALRAKVAAVTAMQTASLGLGLPSFTVPMVPGLHGFQQGAPMGAQSAGMGAAQAGGAAPTSGGMTSAPTLGLGMGAGMPSGTSIIQAPAGVTVNVGASPAQAAGMLGQGGLVSLLAAVAPTRVLVLYNALTDGILESGRAAPTGLHTLLADVAMDVAHEAQRAAPGTLLRVVVPLPAVQGELIDPPVGVKLGGTIKVVGAEGLLEDRQDKDQGILTIPTAHGRVEHSKDGPVVVGANMEGAKVIPLTAEAFYRKVAGGNWSAGLETLPDRPGMGGGAPSGGYGGPSGLWANEEESEVAEPTAGSGGYADDGRTRGLGKVFLEFHDVDAAINAQRELAGRFYEGRTLVATFAHPAKWTAGDLCALGPPGAFVLTKSNAPAAPEKVAAPAAAAAPAAVAAVEVAVPQAESEVVVAQPEPVVGDGAADTAVPAPLAVAEPVLSA